MKIWSFIKWQFRRIETWQLFWMIGFVCIGYGSASRNSYVILAGILIFSGFLLKWVLWDMIKHQYQMFEREQQRLFDTIKNSDK